MPRIMLIASLVLVPLLAGALSQVAVNQGSSDGLDALVELLGQADDQQFQLDLLTGIAQGLEGRRAVPMPSRWPAVYARLRRSPEAAVRQRALQLSLLFGDRAALQLLRSQAADGNADAEIRGRAIRALAASKDPALPEILLKLVADAATQRTALRALAEYDHPDTAAAILGRYHLLDAPARGDALQTLASRPAWAAKLLDAVERERVPRTDLTAFTIRQLQSLGQPELSRRMKQVWGEVRASSGEKTALIAKYHRQLTPATLAEANPSAGRTIFQRTCASCHRLFDAGQRIGPDITGSQRNNLDYLLENILDPSAAVAKDFQMQIVVTTGGRVITGLVIAESPTSVTIRTVNEQLVVPADEIDSRRLSPLSVMPEGLLQQLSSQQVRDLFAYLSSPTQVPLEPAGP